MGTRSLGNYASVLARGGTCKSLLGDYTAMNGILLHSPGNSHPFILEHTEL